MTSVRAQFETPEQMAGMRLRRVWLLTPSKIRHIVEDGSACYFSSNLSETVSADEWWRALIEQCCIKYPSGPTHLGLWERAGGKIYDLLSKGTGREIWVDAISKIRDGRTDVNCKNLIREMLLDYKSSDELKQLKQTTGKYEK
jgi:hypothetical protein